MLTIGTSEWLLTLQLCGSEWMLVTPTNLVMCVGPMILSWIGTMDALALWIGTKVVAMRMRSTMFELSQLVNWSCSTLEPTLASCPTT